MRALVVGAAPWPDADPVFYVRLACEHDLVVAADAAAEWLCELGVIPDVAVGDFDSARAGAPERLRARGISVRTYPRDKDLTDLELAVDEARAAGAGALTLTAAFSARLDHTLAALGLLARAADIAGMAREPGLTAWAMDGATRGSLELPIGVGETVSMMAMLGPAGNVTLSGMEYPLSGADLAPCSGLGLSNRVVSPPATITVGSGSLLVIAPHDRQA
jgi:thiamine pyrophosphokinase